MNNSLAGILSGFINKMFTMEEHKYLPPKFSYALKDMAKYYDIFEKAGNLSNLSKTSSNMSFRSVSLMNEVNENMSTPKNKVDLKPIKESLTKKSLSRNRYRPSSIKETSQMMRKRIKRNGSNSLPPLHNSTSRSRASSKSTKKKSLRFKSRGNGSSIRKVKARMLKNAVSVVDFVLLKAIKIA